MKNDIWLLNNFKYLIVRLDDKIRKLENSEDYIVNLEDNYIYNIFEKFTNKFRKRTENDFFIRNRSRWITIKRAIKELREMKKNRFWIWFSIFQWDYCNLWKFLLKSTENKSKR